LHLFRSHPHNPRVIRKSDRQDFRDEASLIGNQLAQDDTVNLYIEVESIKLIVEEQAFLPSYDFAPPILPPPFFMSKLSLFLSLPVCRRSRLLVGEGERGGRSQILRR